MSEERQNGNPAVDGFEDELASASGEDGGTDSASVSDPAAQLEALVMERDRLADEVEDLRDRLLRRQAEFDNFRRRAERERVEYVEYAAMDSLRALLPVVDDLERALSAAPEGASETADYVNGVGLVYQRLVETLKKLGLEPFESVGKPFDPNIHHAIESVETDEVDDHTVLEEWQKGYNFRGKLLREAMVRVAVKPS